MSKVSYANLKLKVNSDVNTFNFNDLTIEVKKYLPISDKNDLIQITLQKSKEDGVFNPVKVDFYFHLYLIYMYSNLNFTEKQKEDEEKLYDSLVSSGFMDKFLETMEESEYSYLMGYLNDMQEDTLTYKNSAAAIIQSIIVDLPKQAEAMQEILNTFDKEKYQSVIDFATAANGGRPIIGVDKNREV